MIFSANGPAIQQITGESGPRRRATSAGFKTEKHIRAKRLKHAHDGVRERQARKTKHTNGTTFV